MREIFRANGLSSEQIIAIFFSLTADLNAAFPAEAARSLGLVAPALICFQEIPVPGSAPRIVRVLVQAESEASQDAMAHVYLGRASELRPDLGGGASS